MVNTVNMVRVKSVLNKHKKRDCWFLDDYSVNPYLGCSFNCVYCYIRGSKYGENMREGLSAKVNSPQILQKQLKRRARRGEYGIILLSSSTEAYMPVERNLKLTRRLLEIILRFRFPVHIVTKSKLVLRDLDLLGEIDRKAILPDDLGMKLKRGAIISFSISTLDGKVARIFEPGAPSPGERLEAMRKCKEAGFLVGVDYIPVLPFISDSKNQLDVMVKTAKDYGADFVLVGALTLFGKGSAGCKTLYYRVLERYYPELLPKYRDLFRRSPAPPKAYQKTLEEVSIKLCKKYDIRYGILN